MNRDDDKGLKWVSDFPTRFKELIGDVPYRQIGPELGISPSTISAYLSGRRSPKAPVLASIAHYFNVHPVWLMGADIPKYKETPGKTEGLSEDRQHIIDWVMRATDDEVRALRTIADQVLALRGK